MKFVYIFWKGLLISKFKYNTKKELLQVGRDFVEDSLRKGEPLKKQIQVYRFMLDSLYNRKINKSAIWRSDHNIGVNCILALITLKQVDIDSDLEGLYFPPKRKSKTL